MTVSHIFRSAELHLQPIEPAMDEHEVDKLERGRGVRDVVGPVRERVADRGHDLDVLEYLWRKKTATRERSKEE